tara:strand:+ start:91 stop:381 length:291 start_codon:yes stop_codon:yes gene_type:complete
MFTFKKKQIEIEGQKIDIREVSAKGFREFSNVVKDHPNDEVLQMATLIAAGVEQFNGKTVDQVMDLVSVGVMGEIVPHIVEISGMDSDEEEEAKKS